MEGLKIQKNISLWLILLLLSVLSFSCSQDESNQVDQDYLSSQKYSDFKQNADREIAKEQKANTSLQVRLQQFSECGEGNLLSFPVEITAQRLSTLLEDRTEICEENRDQETLKLLAESRFGNQIIRWILLGRETAYRNQELLAVVFQNGGLRSFKTVGIFKKNPSEEIMSEIQIRNPGDQVKIVSRTVRNIFYPLEQKNVITTEYEIDKDGSMREL